MAHYSSNDWTVSTPRSISWGVLMIVRIAFAVYILSVMSIIYGVHSTVTTIEHSPLLNDVVLDNHSCVCYTDTECMAMFGGDGYGSIESGSNP